MNDNNKYVPLEDELLQGVSGGAPPGYDCNLGEDEFPKQGKCYDQGRSVSGKVIKGICPYCRIFTSLPEGADLVVAQMFECSLYGYVKRIKE